MLQALGKFWQRVSSGPREKQALAFLRVATGVFYLYVGNQKLINPHFEANLATTLKSWAATNPFPLYQAFLKQVALPHLHHLSLLVTDGELAIGLSYLLGLFVQVSAPCTVIMHVNYLLASQHTSPSALGINAAFTLISLTLFWGRAGKQYGLDGITMPKPAGGQTSRSIDKGGKKLKAVQDSLLKEQKGKGGKGKPKSKPF